MFFSHDYDRETLPDAWRRLMQGMVLHDLAVRRIPYPVLRGPLDARVAAVRRIVEQARGPSVLESAAPPRLEP